MSGLEIALIVVGCIVFFVPAVILAWNIIATLAVCIAFLACSLVGFIAWPFVKLVEWLT